MNAREMKNPCLLKGDTVALVSPASPVSSDRLQAMTNLLEGHGYHVRIMAHALDRKGFLAGEDLDRAADLREAFEDPEIRGVLCTRGGYGSARLLPHLDLDQMAGSGKLFAGFSDITTLHLALNRRGLPTLHSPMALTLAYPRESWVIDSFVRALSGDLTPPEDATKGTCIHPGTVKGISAGGCVCLVMDAIGTPDALAPKGKILFLEDVDEAPHRIDAMFTHLRRSGILSQVAGVVVGEMTRTDDKSDPDIGPGDWRTIIRERLSGFEIPIMIDYPFGHAKNMLTVGLGVEVELDADQGTVRYLAPK